MKFVERKTKIGCILHLFCAWSKVKTTSIFYFSTRCQCLYHLQICLGDRDRNWGVVGHQNSLENDDNANDVYAFLLPLRLNFSDSELNDPLF